VPEQGSGSLGPVIIGAREIYDKVVQVGGQINGVHADVRLMEQTINELKQDLAEYKDRLRSVERRVWAIPSASTIIAAVALILTFMNG